MMKEVVLVRYGAIPEVGEFSCALQERPPRNAAVVVRTHRGLEIGTLLETVRRPSSPPADPHHAGDEATDSPVVRVATTEDRAQQEALRREAQGEYSQWQNRIAQAQLDLELIDLEWTLDRGKLVLYVLGDRGADTTKLALLAAAEGSTPIEVQPVAAEGVVSMPASGGGCGSGGCGCHT